MAVAGIHASANIVSDLWSKGTQVMNTGFEYGKKGMEHVLKGIEEGKKIGIFLGCDSAKLTFTKEDGQTVSTVIDMKAPHVGSLCKIMNPESVKKEMEDAHVSSGQVEFAGKTYPISIDSNGNISSELI